MLRPQTDTETVSRNVMCKPFFFCFSTSPKNKRTNKDIQGHTHTHTPQDNHEQTTTRDRPHRILVCGSPPTGSRRMPRAERAQAQHRRQTDRRADRTRTHAHSTGVSLCKVQQYEKRMTHDWPAVGASLVSGHEMNTIRPNTGKAAHTRGD